MRPFWWTLVCTLMACATARAELIVLVSDDKPSMTRVAHAIVAQHGAKAEIFNLAGDRARADTVAAAVRANPINNVVAIGSLAAQAARVRLDNKLVVFCQVLNYEQFDLTTPWMKGVSALPAVERQFRAWRQLNPNLRSIGLITGNHMRELVGDAQGAADKLGLELRYEEVTSGREVQPALLRVAGGVQGLWLVPDSTVLSTEVIRDMLAVALRSNIQVLAFTPALLKEGALLSAVADEDDIAQAVLARFKQRTADGGLAGEPVVSPAKTKVQVNDKAAERFHLSVPPEWKSP